MNIIQLEYFLKLAEIKNFRKTAEAFYITQPAISKQITLLEKEWGFPLFERGYRQVKLTPSGEVMLEMLKDTGAQFNDALLCAKRVSRQYAAELRLGLPELSNIGNLSDILAQFQNEHPDIIVKVQYVPMTHLELSDGDEKFDLVVNYDQNLQGKNGISCWTLGRRRHVAIVAKDHPTVQIENPTLSDLAQERTFLPGKENPHLMKGYCAICGRHGFTPPAVEWLPNLESVLMAVRLQLGYVILDDLLELPDRFNLTQIPTDCDFDVKLVWASGSQNPALQQLVNMICEKFQMEDTGVCPE